MVQAVRKVGHSGTAALAALVVLFGTFSLSVHGEEDAGCLGGKGEACCNLDWTGQGATIVKMGGDVMTSQSPWVNASVGMRVGNGGRVMTLDNSFAVVAFDDGCWHEMAPNELLTIEDVSPCCAALLPPAPPPVAAPAAAGWIPPAAAVVTAIVGGAVLLDRDDNDREPQQPPPISR